ncbi:MAG: LysR family transcriptional regulator [Treponema sp.]|jgi:lysyl-tRNA synthetase class 2|nr:LysR family transcriptional regulator [Treponema sp.]
MDLEVLYERARLFREIRSFFDQRNYLELDTPLLSPDLIPETCLEVFETACVAPPGSKTRSSRPYWLIPSPEIWMKKLIARHCVSVYQICKCFRNGESTGHLHSPEFTMLEYYTMEADYRDSLALTEELFARLLELCPQGAGELCSDELCPPSEGTELRQRQSPGLRPPFLRLTMEDAFARYAGFDLFKAVERGTLADEARRLGLNPPPDLAVPALYDLIFIHAVEPSLPKDRIVALTDYPAFVPCLAKKSGDGRTVERWELYARGIELANCYSEETDPGEIRRYFDREGQEKNRTALVPHTIDEDYWKNFLPRADGPFPGGEPQGFPQCSGVAMGLDRLFMALMGKSCIDAALPFPMSL